MKNLVKKYAIWFVVVISVIAMTVGATQAVNAYHDRQIEVEITEQKLAERHTRIHDILVQPTYGNIRVWEVTENGFGEQVDSRYYLVPIGEYAYLETEVR